MDRTGRRVLLQELLLLELELVQEAGRTPAPEPYHARFPEDGELVDAVFDAIDHPAATELPGGADRGDLAPGCSIGQYVVLGKLDEGGEGRVYRVLHPVLGQPLILKLARRAASRRPRGRTTARWPRRDCWPS